MQRKKTHTIDNSLLSKRANAANVCVRWPRCSGSYSASVSVFVLQQLDVMAVTAAMARTNGNRKSRRRDDAAALPFQAQKKVGIWARRSLRRESYVLKKFVSCQKSERSAYLLGKDFDGPERYGDFRECAGVGSSTVVSTISAS